MTNFEIINPEFSQNFETNQIAFDEKIELVSKELNHLAAILHVYARGLNFMK